MERRRGSGGGEGGFSEQFSEITRVAIAEILNEAGCEGRYGLFLDEEGLERAVDGLTHLFLTSRRLQEKAARRMRGPS